MILLDENRNKKKYALIAGAVVLLVLVGLAIIIFRPKNNKIEDSGKMTPEEAAQNQKSLFEAINKEEPSETSIPAPPPDVQKKIEEEMSHTINAEAPAEETIPVSRDVHAQENKSLMDAINAEE